MATCNEMNECISGLQLASSQYCFFVVASSRSLASCPRKRNEKRENEHENEHTQNIIFSSLPNHRCRLYFGLAISTSWCHDSWRHYTSSLLTHARQWLSIKFICSRNWIYFVVAQHNGTNHRWHMLRERCQWLFTCFTTCRRMCGILIEISVCRLVI